MAQHISVEQFRQKVFEKVKQSIVNDFKNPYINGSLKYERLRNRLHEYDYKDYQINEHDEVYLTSRHIGNGFVYGTNRGDFEVHYDTKKKKILAIFLVA